MPQTTKPTRATTAIDRRIWWLIALIGLFAYIVMKEVSLPREILAAFGALGFLGILMVGIQSPEIPFYVLVAYLPFSRVMVGHFGIEATAFNTTNILMAWVFCCYAIHRLSQRQPLFGAAPLSKWVWVFCALGAVSLFRIGWQYGSWYVGELIIPLKRWLTPMLCYFLTLWVVREKRTLKATVILIMVAVAMVGAMAVWDYSQVSAGTSLEKSRIGGIAQNPNTLGAFFNYYMFLWLGFFLVSSKHKGRVWLLLVPFLLCFRGIMVTFSRGAYLAFAAGNLSACFFRRKVLFAVAAAVLAFAVMNPWLLPAGIRFRMGQTFESDPNDRFYDAPMEESLEGSAATRVAIWRGAVEIIKDHPWWGVGYGAFPTYITYYTQGAEEYRDAHNSYLLIAAEMGIPTLLLFLFILLLIAYYTRRLYRRTTDPFLKATALGFLAGLGGLLVANMFGSRLDAQETTSYFWILCALIMRALLIERQEASAQRSGARGKSPASGRLRPLRVQPA